MSTNADRIQALVEATPYKWPTNRIAKVLGITTGSAHRSCTTLEKYGLIRHQVTFIDRRAQSIWYRVGRA